MRRFDWFDIDGIQVNDQFIPYLPHVLEDKGSVGEMKEYKNAWYLEALIRETIATA